MDFPKDGKVYDINDEYMFGQGLIGLTVTDSLYEAGKQAPPVTDLSTVKNQTGLPAKGSKWIDFLDRGNLFRRQHHSQ